MALGRSNRGYPAIFIVIALGIIFTLIYLIQPRPTADSTRTERAQASENTATALDGPTETRQKVGKAIEEVAEDVNTTNNR